MNATLLKRLFGALQKGQGRDVSAVCEKIIEDERRRGHKKLATELERLAPNGEKSSGETPLSTGLESRALAPLPLSRREVTALVQVIPHERLRHYMILPPPVESRFIRIEKEYAARTRLANFGLRARTRVLLHGPPGCGKSLGAERLAWATGLPMHKVRFDSLISSYFGETAGNLRRVFDDAERRPCALFLDECDTIARSRLERNDVGEASRVVNMLLQLLEDFRAEGIVIAATNVDEALDPAIFRRFDEVFEVPRPGRGEIARLLKTTVSAVEVGPTVSWNHLAESLEGCSCSEAVQVAQSAAKRAVMANRAVVEQADFEAAISELHRVA
jgi:SpoVK/Ycf46/Vps4 family AAA+-type ATPase